MADTNATETEQVIGELPLSKEELKHFQDILLARKKDINSNIEHLNDILSTPEHEQNGGHNYGDFADKGTDAMEREKNFLFLSRDKKFLVQIENALQRIDNGTYGVCVETGQQIPRARLEAVPTTTKTIIAKNIVKS
jgi:DnaK suppressor protein